jgi:hypothetical protein
MRHAKYAVPALLAVVAMGGAALAQVGWLFEPPFSVQRDVYWSFNDPASLFVPEYYGPDDYLLYDSDFVVAENIDVLDGRLGIDNSQGLEGMDGFLTFHLDNWNMQRPAKLVWLQFTIYPSGPGGWGLVVSGPDVYGYLALAESVDNPDGSTTWLFGALLTPNPPWEEVFFQICADPGEVRWIDDLRVATACVPEPGLICLVGLGALGFVARRRK